MNPPFVIDDLTGSPALGYYFKDKPNDMTGDIKRYSTKDKLMILNTNNNKM